MRKFAGLLMVALLSFPPAAAALNGSPDLPASDGGAIYGGEMMTPMEQDAYRRKMWELKTEAERERFRREHHERMRERARDLGVHLPDDPVHLDRPYFEKSRGERVEGEKPRSGESLRRWPEGTEKKKSSLRRWKEKSGEGWSEKDAEGTDPGKESGATGVRRWPPERKPVIRPESLEKEAAPRVPPGAGLMDR